MSYIMLCILFVTNYFLIFYLKHIRKVYILKVIFVFNMAVYLVDFYIQKKKKMSIHNTYKINLDCDGSDLNEQVHQQFTTFTFKYLDLKRSWQRAFIPS